jgi:hypothetical protein
MHGKNSGDSKSSFQINTKRHVSWLELTPFEKVTPPKNRPTRSVRPTNGKTSPNYYFSDDVCVQHGTDSSNAMNPDRIMKNNPNLAEN